MRSKSFKKSRRNEDTFNNQGKRKGQHAKAILRENPVRLRNQGGSKSITS